MKIFSYISHDGQQTIEYMLLFAGLVALIVVVLATSNLLQRNVDGGLEQAVKGIECMAETACLDTTTGCTIVCGNGCCEPGEVAVCASDCP